MRTFDGTVWPNKIAVRLPEMQCAVNACGRDERTVRRVSYGRDLRTSTAFFGLDDDDGLLLALVLNFPDSNTT